MHEKKIYAGIGARATPRDVQQVMASIGSTLGRYGWTLRSGHAEGADQAFEYEAKLSGGKIEIYLPWNGFEKAYHDGVNYFAWPPGDVYQRKAVTDRALEIAEQFHPKWDRCDDSTRKMHARNVHQIDGPLLKSKAELVVCWTEGGKRGGGTGQALRIAEHEDVPIFDLAVHTAQQVLDFINHGVLP